MNIDDSTKVAQETFQDRVHSETSMHEDKYENLSITSGSSGRVIEAFTMLQENPDAQVIKLQLVLQVSRQSSPRGMFFIRKSVSLHVFLLAYKKMMDFTYWSRIVYCLYLQYNLYFLCRTLLLRLLQIRMCGKLS
jgi:hypothetical protein